jgi:hypothetical protein
MTKQRKPAMKNQEIIDLLDKHVTGGSKQFMNPFTKVRYRTRWRHFTKEIQSYYIPMSVFQEITGKRFNPKLKIGSQVRLRTESSRRYTRDGSTQDVADTYSFSHLGIGSGRVYEFTELADDSQRGASLSNKLLLGKRFVLNLFHSQKMAKLYNSRGWRLMSTWGIWDDHTTKDGQKIINFNLYPRWKDYRTFVKPYLFNKSIKLDGEGIFGLKKSISGYVSEVYIHFQQPTWETKRESRFEVKFETGAKVVFTDDFLDPVYDTDYETDQAVYYCTKNMNCRSPMCDHMSAHALNDECHGGCNMDKEAQCQKLYDFTNLCETTVGKGILEDGK